VIRIVITDDHELLREGVKKIIGHSEGMRVVGEATNIADTVQLIVRHSPDVVILDVNLPGHNGLDGLMELRRHFPDLSILVLSMYAEETLGIQALKAGADGYISKVTAAEEVPDAILSLFAGGTYVSPRLAKLLAAEVRERRAASRIEGLTVRELQVAMMVASGKTAKQIAAELSISISSVNTYRRQIFNKLKLTSDATLICYTIQHGLAQ
jgi:two-component system invasion response regulator UvrY